MHRHTCYKKESDKKIKETFNCDRCKYICNKKDTVKAHYSRNHKEIEETILEFNLFDYTSTKKDTHTMHKDRKHKGKLINCY